MCQDTKQSIDTWRKQKFNIGNDAESAAKEASSGLWKNKRTKASRKKKAGKENPLAAAYELHKSKEDAKSDFAQQRLLQGEKQLTIMENIGRNINIHRHGLLGIFLRTSRNGF